MVGTLGGEHGADVQLPVEMELRPEIEFALLLHLFMEVLGAQGTTHNPLAAMTELVEVRKEKKIYIYILLYRYGGSVV